MQAFRNHGRQLSLMVFLVLLTGWLAPAHAGIVGTGELLMEQRTDMDRAALVAMLEQDKVKAMLAGMGVSEQMVEERIASLTPAELASFQQQLAEAPTGEGVVGVIVLFLLVFIITDMLCATNIFSFVNCIR
ncbi:MAG: PA2779 family protein [Marinobacter sp.]|nr:PA2779 family protein [Marinobacter sp.]